MYCDEADELHRVLLLCPRPLPRIATTPLPPTPKEKQSAAAAFGNGGGCSWSSDSPPSMTPPRSLLESRRMSRSEGDLKKFVLPLQPPPLRSSGSQQQLILQLPPRHGLPQKVNTSTTGCDSIMYETKLFHFNKYIYI